MTRSADDARSDTLALGSAPEPPEIPYGTLGVPHGLSRCPECWNPRWMWVGNRWAIVHLPPGLSECRHACHSEEIWLAAP